MTLALINNTEPRFFSVDFILFAKCQKLNLLGIHFPFYKFRPMQAPDILILSAKSGFLIKTLPP